MRKLKVFAGVDTNTKTKRQCHMVIAATSREKARAILNEKGLMISASRMANYWSETGNKDDIAMALSKPGTLFQTESTAYDKKYTEA